jgi:hypothetical protein
MNQSERLDEVEDRVRYEASRISNRLTEAFKESVSDSIRDNRPLVKAYVREATKRLFIAVTVWATVVAAAVTCLILLIA